MKSAALYYIEPYYHEKLNRAIEENFRSIEKSFKQIGLSFVYLPKLMIDKHFNKVLEYNRPYLQHSDKSDLPMLYQLIISQYSLNISGPALVYLSDKPEELQLFELASGPGKGLSFDLTLPGKNNHRDLKSAAFYSFIEEITKKSAEKHRDAGIRFRKGGLFERDKEIDLTTVAETPIDSYKECNRDEEQPFFDSELQILEQAALYPNAETVDADFQREAFFVSEELRHKILELSAAGHLLKLIDLLEKLYAETRKLSRLRISANHRLYLTDYQNKEVKMTPLPKALFLLFLNHPEGILFKELADYREELMEIYQTISLRENIDKARKSIEDMTDPLNNSINEKCSTIRAAFLNVVSDDLAVNYYITGQRGEAKRIMLDRELVVRE